MAARAQQALLGRANQKGGTVERILDAAEWLFAKFGVEGVSTRQIILEAGASNKSAVAYHFGDRENLVRAIWERRLPELEVIRATMLEDMRAQGLQDDAHALARALFLPSYQIVDQHGRHTYMRFLGQALRWGVWRTMRAEVMWLSPSSQEATILFKAVLPPMSDHFYASRLRMVSALLSDAVAMRDDAMATMEPVLAEHLFIEEMTELAVACCMAPAPCGPRT